jgi:hypothetical protein
MTKFDVHILMRLVFLLLLSNIFSSLYYFFFFWFHTTWFIKKRHLFHMSQPLCYCHNWVREIFENRVFKGSWFSGVLEQESFGTQRCTIQTEIHNSDHSVRAHRRLRKLRHLFEELNRSLRRKSPFELRTAVPPKDSCSTTPLHQLPLKNRFSNIFLTQLWK